MTTLQSAAQKQLRQFVEQLETLAEQKAAISDDIREKMAEAKAVGFDVKALRTIIRMRKKTKDQRDEEEGILATYMSALGMLADTPLGQYAVQRDIEDAITERHVM